jgi:hypothetical protein
MTSSCRKREEGGGEGDRVRGVGKEGKWERGRG